jgi:dihydroorotase-like cyclic amidohydrolase
MAEVLTQRARGLPIQAEVTPQHLTLTVEDESRLGNSLVLHPPIRTAEHQSALWSALEAGDVQSIGTDDVPASRAETGKLLGEHECWKGKSGMVGVETMLPILITEGHLRRGLPLTRIVELCSYNAARIFGLPDKGRLEVGADADVVVIDLTRRTRIEAQGLHNNADFTVFEGMEVCGWPTATVLRGRVVARDGEPVGPPTGRYMLRGPSADAYRAASAAAR